MTVRKSGLRAYFNRNKDFTAFFSNLSHGMTINATPGGDVIFYTGISGQNFQDLTFLHLGNFVLGTYDGHGAEQVAGVEMLGHV
jgi:hypothetical protein